MIILDAETSGISARDNGVLSLGAVDYNSGEEFYQECRIADFRQINPVALEINGFTLDQIHDKTKQTEFELYWNFVDWSKNRGNVLGGHNVGHFDILFLEDIHNLHASAVKFPFSYRTVDLHSIAFAVFKESFTHEQICIRLGLEPEQKPHNALFGARSEAQALKILLERIK